MNNDVGKTMPFLPPMTSWQCFTYDIVFTHIKGLDRPPRILQVIQKDGEFQSLVQGQIAETKLEKYGDFSGSNDVKFLGDW